MPGTAAPAEKRDGEGEVFVLDRDVHWRTLSEDERRRQEAILEFISTEASYHDRLVTLHEVFHRNSAKSLAADEQAMIFQNLPDLITQSSILLADLRSRQVEGDGVMSSVSDIYLEHVRNGSFECFRAYCAGHGEGSRLVNERTESNRSFAKLLRVLPHRGLLTICRRRWTTRGVPVWIWPASCWSPSSAWPAIRSSSSRSCIIRKRDIGTVQRPSKRCWPRRSCCSP